MALMSQRMADRKMNESFRGLMVNSIKDVVTVFKMQLKIPAKITYRVFKDVLPSLSDLILFCTSAGTSQQLVEDFI